MNDEQIHLTHLYARLQADTKTLAAQLAAITAEGRETKRQLAREGHLDLANYSESLESFASIEANNRQIDTLNARLRTTQTRLAHARLLLPQAFFAKLALDYGDGREAVYLGKVGYADAQAHYLVYDWRAPVADAYYANRLGAVTYRANQREIAVTVLDRRQFVIDHDRLIHEVAGSQVGDPLLLAVLAADRSGALQEITATIQREQNAVIRETAHPIVLVAGVAGSGKTSVLLQRIAYQLYQHRDEWQPDNVLVLTPNMAFGHYIRGVLPALGEAEPMSVTYARFTAQLARRFLLPTPGRQEQLVRIEACLQQPLNASPVLVGRRAWRQTDPDASALVRLQRVWRVLLAEGRAPASLAEWLSLDVLRDAWGLEALSAYDALYLWVRLTNYRQPGIKAVYIDEAQDYPAAAWLLLKTVFADAELTIVGDHRQRLSGAPVALAEFFAGPRVASFRLATSYRATGAITAVFAAYAGDWAPQIQAVQPQGTSPQTLARADWQQVVGACAEATPSQSIAVLTPSLEEAEAAARAFTKARVLSGEGQAPGTGINVLPLAVAKGLEFDHVFILDWQGAYYQDAAHGQNRRYVAASRGTKTLTFVE